MKSWKKEILTIPNMLSLFRLLLIPVYIIIYLNAYDAYDYILAGAILAVSCLTDLIDGRIARKFNMISTVGKILDPLADKMTQLTLILCLAFNHPILWTLIVLFFIKEGFMLIAGSINFKKGKMLKGALFSGKICTTILFVSLIIMVMLPNISPVICGIITAIDSVFMLLAFTDYVIAYRSKESKFQDVNPHFLSKDH